MASNIGTVDLFATDFLPAGWLPCSGEKLQIECYPDLFAKIGTRFGGDGTKTFKLPDYSKQAPPKLRYGIACQCTSPTAVEGGG